MQLDMTKLNLIAQEWDPVPFLQASEQAMAMQQLPTTQPDLAGGAPAEATQAPNFAALFGGAPEAGGQAPLPASMMQGLMQQPQQQAPRAPAVAPQRGAAPKFPGMPQIGKVPTLAELLGGG